MLKYTSFTQKWLPKLRKNILHDFYCVEKSRKPVFNKIEPYFHFRIEISSYVKIDFCFYFPFYWTVWKAKEKGTLWHKKTNRSSVEIHDLVTLIDWLIILHRTTCTITRGLVFRFCVFRLSTETLLINLVSIFYIVQHEHLPHAYLSSTAARTDSHLSFCV